MVEGGGTKRGDGEGSRGEVMEGRGERRGNGGDEEEERRGWGG